jgi:hypothetical protein
MSDATQPSRSPSPSDLSELPSTPTPPHRSTAEMRASVHSVPEQLPAEPLSPGSRRTETDPLHQLILELQSQMQVQAQMQSEMQARLQEQQRISQARIISLLNSQSRSPIASTTAPPMQRPSPHLVEPIRNVSPPAQILPENARLSSTLRVPELPFNSPPHSQPHVEPPLQQTHQIITHAAKVKASDLPKYSGLDTEDIEVWIERLSAIFEANRVTDAEITGHISVTLKDNASLWYTKLGSDVRSSLSTWAAWKRVLRQRFQKANYATDKKREWKKRELKSDEKMSAYFDDKVYLQTFVFDSATSDRERIEDLMDGLPKYMVPVLKGSLLPGTDLLEFRRILLDYEDGLRPYRAWNYKASEENGPVRSRTHSERPLRGTEAPKPPRPCSCGGLHWYKDCPNKATKSNSAMFRRSEVNRIPVTRSRWPNVVHQDVSPDNLVSQPAQQAQAQSNSAILPGLPEQDNEGYQELYADLGIDLYPALDTQCHAAVSNNVMTQYIHQDTTTYAVAETLSSDNADFRHCDNPKGPNLYMATAFEKCPDANLEKDTGDASSTADSALADGVGKDRSSKDYRNANDVSRVDQEPIPMEDSYTVKQGYTFDPARGKHTAEHQEDLLINFDTTTPTDQANNFPLTCQTHEQTSAMAQSQPGKPPAHTLNC